ncbi:MAG: lytic murein transglycosylase [Beijerinckiaceae bacterium]|nr:lytic murein transglycosylase [Beijerinckiaceae bacterium]
MKRFGRLAHPALALVALALAAAIAPARADFASCVSGLRSHALGQGISGATFDRMMSGVTPDMKIIEAMNAQPEFRTPIWDYLATLVDEQKIAEGRAMLARHASVLSRIEQAYGVDRHTVVAVWGVESDYGQVPGRWSLPQALSTAACFGTRRREFFRTELVSTMKIVQRGDLDAEKLRGSWAGAFGHTQFIPSTYLRLAVDFDGDGRRDLVDSIPDALASTANYLKKSGWITGASWGYEVRLPAGYAGPSGRTGKQDLASWAGRGITRIDGSALSGLPAAGLLLPAGRNGPAFLVTRNFDAAYAYNAAESYALAISVLSDRLRGRPGIRTPWPTDDRGLSRAERKELQERLVRAGYDVGKPDGAIGPLTRAAIKDVEAKLGMPQTGRAGGKVFDSLR